MKLFVLLNWKPDPYIECIVVLTSRLNQKFVEEELKSKMKIMITNCVTIHKREGVLHNYFIKLEQSDFHFVLALLNAAALDNKID